MCANISPEHFESRSVEASLQSLLKKQKQEVLDKKITSGLNALKDALQSAKSYADTEDDADKLAELTNPWKVWEKKWTGRSSEYHEALGQDKKTQAKNQDQVWQLLKANDTAKLMRQIWRQEMFEYIMEKKKDPVVIEKMLAAQKIAPTSFENYLAPALRLGFTLSPAEKKTMKEPDGSNFDGTLQDMIPDGQTAKNIKINVGSGMISIPKKLSGALKFRNYTISDDKTKIYALMANGCEGNFVVIDLTAKKEKAPVSKPKVVPPPVPTPRDGENPPSEWWTRNHKDQSQKHDGDRAWSGQWIDPSVENKEDTPVKTKNIGTINYFYNTGWIQGSKGIGKYDETTKNVVEFPIDGIGEVTGIYKTGSDNTFFVLGKEGFAEFDAKSNKIIQTISDIGMIRDNSQLSKQWGITLWKKWIAIREADGKYTIKKIEGIGEIVWWTEYITYNIRAKNGVAYYDEDTKELKTHPLGIGEIKYFQEWLAISETGVAFIDRESHIVQEFQIPESERWKIKSFYDDKSSGWINSSFENGVWKFRLEWEGDGDEIILDKGKLEAFQNAIAGTEGMILEGSTLLLADDIPWAKKRLGEAKASLDKEPIKSTSDENEEKKRTLESYEKLKTDITKKEQEKKTTQIRDALNSIDASLTAGEKALSAWDLAKAKNELTIAESWMTKDPIKSLNSPEKTNRQDRINKLKADIQAKEQEMQQLSALNTALKTVNDAVIAGNTSLWSGNQNGIDTAKTHLKTAKDIMWKDPLKSADASKKTGAQDAVTKLETEIQKQEGWIQKISEIDARVGTVSATIAIDIGTARTEFDTLSGELAQDQVWKGIPDTFAMKKWVLSTLKKLGDDIAAKEKEAQKYSITPEEKRQIETAIVSSVYGPMSDIGVLANATGDELNIAATQAKMQQFAKDRWLTAPLTPPQMGEKKTDFINRLVSSLYTTLAKPTGLNDIEKASDEYEMMQLLETEMGNTSDGKIQDFLEMYRRNLPLRKNEDLIKTLRAESIPPVFISVIEKPRFTVQAIIDAWKGDQQIAKKVITEIYKTYTK